jgi:hypothetical protein
MGGDRETRGEDGTGVQAQDFRLQLFVSNPFVKIQ